jgi:hypothetical protein
LIQPLSTVIYTLDRLSDIVGCTAVVVGLGPIVLLATWLLNKYGASKISASIQSQGVVKRRITLVLPRPSRPSWTWALIGAASRRWPICGPVLFVALSSLVSS